MDGNMRRNRICRSPSPRVVVLVLLLTLLAIPGDCDASFLPKLRQLAPTAAPPSSLHKLITPAPSPGPSENGSVGNVTSSSSSDASKAQGGKKGTGSNADGNSSITSKDKPGQVGKDDKTKKTGYIGEPKNGVEAGPAENCTGVTRVCDDPNSGIVACFLNPQPGSKEMVILVENNGEAILRANLTAPSSNDSAVLEVQKHQKQKVNLAVGNGSTVILRTDLVKCNLSTDPPVPLANPAPEENYYFRLPSTDKLVTPVNGAYFLILAVVIFGGACACFMLRSKGRQDGIPYQELEMTVPESSPRMNADAADGWDEDWGDDWDEESAVTAPGARLAGSISANGLTSRSTNKDGWDSSWDD